MLFDRLSRRSAYRRNAIAQNRKIIDLLASLHFEATDEIEEEREPAWLPVWGWLQGIFPLPPQPVPETIQSAAAELEARLEEDGCSVPRLWFDMLTLAERLRVIDRDGREVATLRRLMKKENDFMFCWYLKKIRARG